MATKKVKDKRLYSLTEYRVQTKEKRVIGAIEIRGFRVWMKLDKKQSLSARTVDQWNALFAEFQKA